MAPADPYLMAHDPAVIDQLLKHPMQFRATQVVGALLAGLRGCREWGDYYEFQGELFRELHDGQVHRSRIKRGIRRLNAGKDPDVTAHEPSQDLQIDLLVCDRVVRQLRSVGDALAWRLFQYDRRFIQTLSLNKPAGPMANKKGLDYELGRIVHLWEHKHHFGLLHDMTTCLRIADVSEFTGDGLLFHEVKKNAARSDPKQLARIQAAIDAIQGRAPLRSDRGDASLFRSSLQYKTHLRRLEDIVNLAMERGCIAARVGSQYVVGAVAVRSQALTSDTDFELKRYVKVRERAVAKAGFNRATHNLRAFSADTAARDPTTAPLGIYPLSPDLCADMISDLLVIEVIISDEVLRDAFERVGFETEILLPQESSNFNGDNPIVRLRLEDRGLVIHGTAINQLLLELVDVHRYAAALREMFDARLNTPGAVLVYRNERAHWK
jgi:hypothetical protein